MSRIFHDRNHTHRLKAFNEWYFAQKGITTQEAKDKEYKVFKETLDKAIKSISFSKDSSGKIIDSEREQNIKKAMKTLYFECFFEYAYVPTKESLISIFNNTVQNQFEESRRKSGKVFESDVLFGSSMESPHFLSLVKHKLRSFYDHPDTGYIIKDIPNPEFRTAEIVAEAASRILVEFGITSHEVNLTKQDLINLANNVDREGKILSAPLPKYPDDKLVKPSIKRTVSTKILQARNTERNERGGPKHGGRLEGNFTQDEKHKLRRLSLNLGSDGKPLPKPLPIYPAMLEPKPKRGSFQVFLANRAIAQTPQTQDPVKQRQRVLTI